MTSLRTADLDYVLPPDRIAQEPLADRAAARLLVVRRGRRGVEHAAIADLPRLLPSGTLAVVNDTRVIRARLLGTRDATGGKAELLLVRRLGASVGGVERWSALLSTRGRPREGERISFGTIEATLVSRGPRGEVTIDLRCAGGDLDAAIAREGRVPLPPYIRRPDAPRDADRYQTVYARVPGAVAAPTAGLHFTPGLLDAMRAAGHAIATVTLHVGPGTFRPVRVERFDDHEMHAERAEVPAETAASFREARSDGRTVLAVGTTVVRTLETAAERAGRPGEIAAFEGDTSLYVRPGHRFAAVDALLTNFHLPRSTLIALVAAFHGVPETLAAYAEAVAAGYRFYSYGDAMLVLPAEAPRSAAGNGRV